MWGVVGGRSDAVILFCSSLVQANVPRVPWKARQDLQVNAWGGKALQSQDIPRKQAHLVMQGSAGTLCCQEVKSVLSLSMYHSKAVFLAG